MERLSDIGWDMTDIMAGYVSQMPGASSTHSVFWVWGKKKSMIGILKDVENVRTKKEVIVQNVLKGRNTL